MRRRMDRFSVCFGRDLEDLANLQLGRVLDAVDLEQVRGGHTEFFGNLVGIVAFFHFVSSCCGHTGCRHRADFGATLFAPAALGGEVWVTAGATATEALRGVGGFVVATESAVAATGRSEPIMGKGSSASPGWRWGAAGAAGATGAATTVDEATPVAFAIRLERLAIRSGFLFTLMWLKA